MVQGFFITGTDTNVGKTWVTVTLMRYFQAQGKSVVGMKPVASGCELINGLLRNQDALLLQKNASVALDYGLINPYAYPLAISPHIAGEKNPVDLNKIVVAFDQLKQNAQIVLVEGVGGWLVPLNNHGDDVQALAKSLKLPVLMVVAMRLGCINHARLTYQAIVSSGLRCAGWLATCVDLGMENRDENIESLRQLIHAPLLGVLPYSKEVDFDLFIKSIDFVGDINHNQDAVIHTQS
jgi:dethiobiotin synthetase